MDDSDQQTVTPSKGMPTLRWLLLPVLAVLVIWLGVSWRYGWFPFSPRDSRPSLEEMMRLTTGTGPEETPTPEMIKDTTGKEESGAAR
jgi:hypothetical protein